MFHTDLHMASRVCIDVQSLDPDASEAEIKAAEAAAAAGMRCDTINPVGRNVVAQVCSECLAKYTRALATTPPLRPTSTY